MVPRWEGRNGTYAGYVLAAHFSRQTQEGETQPYAMRSSLFGQVDTPTKVPQKPVTGSRTSQRASRSASKSSSRVPLSAEYEGKR